MNVSITIADETRSFQSATRDWINHLFSRAHQAGVLPIVRVQVNQPGLMLGLATPGAGLGGGGGTLTPAQNRVLEAWLHHRLGSNKYTGGNLIAFLNDLERILG